MSYAANSQHTVHILNVNKNTLQFTEGVKKCIFDLYNKVGLDGGNSLKVSGVLDGTAYTFVEFDGFLRETEKYRQSFQNMDVIEDLPAYKDIELNFDYDLDIFYFREGYGIARFSKLFHKNLTNYVTFRANESIDFKPRMYQFEKQDGHLSWGFVEASHDFERISDDSVWTVRNFWFTLVQDVLSNVSKEAMEEIEAISKTITEQGVELKTIIDDGGILLDFSIEDWRDRTWVEIQWFFTQFNRLINLISQKELCEPGGELHFQNISNKYQEIFIAVSSEDIPDYNLEMTLFDMDDGVDNTIQSSITDIEERTLKALGLTRDTQLQ